MCVSPQYALTIGFVEPSYVIRQFLDARRIGNLTEYLERLHSAGVASSDHTTLLLNCFTKLKDEEKLDEFLSSDGAGGAAGAAGGAGGAGGEAPEAYRRRFDVGTVLKARAQPPLKLPFHFSPSLLS